MFSNVSLLSSLIYLLFLMEDILFLCFSLFSNADVVKVMTSNAEWGIFDADIQMRMVWPECYLLLNSHCPPMPLIVLKVLSHFFLTVLTVSLCFPPDSSMLILVSCLIPDFSIVIPQVSSLSSPRFLPFSSHVSSLLILMMIVIKSIWWCPPLLSSARWWCFMSVLSLRSDYRGWLLIIFILNISLWWYLFLSF